MACHKILIDYSEYVRLKKYEERYEEEEKRGENNLRGGGADVQENVSANIRPPLLGTTDSITLPASATLETEHRKVHKASKKKEMKKENTTNTNNAWYYLGLPTLSK